MEYWRSESLSLIGQIFGERKSAGVSTVSNNYWSSTTNPSNTTNAFNVNFNNGNANNNDKTNANYVRCVRGKLILAREEV